ncbi:MAG: ATP-binding protein, partial [Persicimonas sp.]
LGYMPIPLIFRRTGSFALASNLFAGILWALLVVLIAHTGDLQSPVMLWLVVMPLIPHIFDLKKSFYIWLFITIMTVVVFWVGHNQGYGLSFLAAYDDHMWAGLWAFSIIIGLVAISQLFALNSGLQRWLSQKVRMREAEKRRTELALHEAEQREAERKMENKMLEMDRMVAVGTLAAGVAHEINNPLAFVHANVEYLLSQTEKYSDDADLSAAMTSREETIEVLEDIREGSLRIRNIVSDLSTFSTTDRGEAQPLDIQNVVESCIRMSENHIRHRARLVRDFHIVPAVHGVESSLAQVFLNLLINAAQSIDEGDVESNEVRVSIRLADAGETVVVEVSDTGGGIPKDVRKRIFEPFFTTKDKQEGMGMGLAICRKLVRSHGGNIYFESSQGQGTTFTVELPADPKEAEASNQFQRPVFAHDQKGRALVIDDEQQVGRTIRRMLIDSYDSVMLTSGRQALELLEEDRDFAVIVCDLLMPDGSGVEMYAEMKRRFPELVERMVFVTGGTFTEATREFVEACEQPIVPKPFDMSEFRAVVDETAVVV